MVAPPVILERVGGRALVVQLLWLEPGGADRLWADPALAPLLEALGQAPKDEPANAYARSLTLPAEAFREALTVLAQAEPVGEQGMAAALARVSAGGGAVAAPLLVVAGELELALNARAALHAAAEVAAALLPLDDRARAAVAQARAVPEALGVGAVPAVARVHARLRQACAEAAVPLATQELDSEVTRTLLAGQLVQRRALFGAEHVRTLLHAEGASYPLIAYLPAAAASFLPLVPRFAVRALVEVHPPQDPIDPGPIALRVVALARISPKPHWEA